MVLNHLRAKSWFQRTYGPGFWEQCPKTASKRDPNTVTASTMIARLRPEAQGQMSQAGVEKYGFISLIFNVNCTTFTQSGH
jgi:hypothetical protein